MVCDRQVARHTHVLILAPTNHPPPNAPTTAPKRVPTPAKRDVVGNSLVSSFAHPRPQNTFACGVIFRRFHESRRTTQYVRAMEKLDNIRGTLRIRAPVAVSGGQCRSSTITRHLSFFLHKTTCMQRVESVDGARNRDPFCHFCNRIGRNNGSVLMLHINEKSRNVDGRTHVDRPTRSKMSVCPLDKRVVTLGESVDGQSHWGNSTSD
jgi:hypothetical protein